MRLRPVLVSLALLAAAGCAGDSDNASSAADSSQGPTATAEASSPAAAPATTAPAPESDGDYTENAQMLAALETADLQCVGYEQGESLGAKEDGVCKLQGATIALVIYPSAEAQQQARQAVTAFDSGYLIEGDAWLVAVIGGSESLAEKVHSALGGDLSEF